MTASIALLVFGLAVLLGGGHLLVTGASGLARAFGVSPLVIGLTVVAFGTSAPELAVNLIAAIEDRGAISFGNIVGSNLANIGLILGTAALLRPLDVQGRILARELPILLLVTLVATALVLDGPLRTLPAGFDRVDGLVLLLLFAGFLYVAWGDVTRGRPTDPLVTQSEQLEIPAEPTGRWRSALFTLVGLAALVGGGELAVSGAVDVARRVGLSEAVIGLTIIAVGTSLPELVASCLASVKGESDIAVGNVIGSNVFNLLLIMGTTAVMRPVDVPEGGLLDVAALVAATLLLLPFGRTHGRRFVRWEGAVLLATWLAYTTWRTTAGPG